MKKLFLTGLVALLVGSASAQIVTSRSSAVKKIRKDRTYSWLIHAGIGMNNMPGLDYGYAEKTDVSAKFGYNIGIQVNFPLSTNTYWGMDLSVGSTGCKFEGEWMDWNRDWNTGEYIYFPAYYKFKVELPALIYSPFIYGCKIPVGKNCSFDLQAGPYIGWIFSKDTKIDYYSSYEGSYSCSEGDYGGYVDCGMKLGVGFWIKKVKLDLSYQQGLVDHKGGYGWCKHLKSCDLFFSVGRAF